MSFWLYGVLICLCLVTITGCFFKANPETQNLKILGDATLSNITLTRRVVPEFGSEFRTFQGKSEYVKVESKSRFGDPDEEPDLSCIHAGLRKALPTIDIIPTATFWEQIDAPQDAVELTELFAKSQSDWLRALQADVLVIAYHARIDLESEKKEFLYGGWISDQEKETASVVVVDLSRSTIIHGSRITFNDMDFVGHGGYFVPLAFVTLSPSDICKTVAEQAGRMIALKMPGRNIRALVVLAAENLAVRKDLNIHVVSESDLEWSEEEAQILRKAEQGDAHAQYRLYTMLIESQPSIAYKFLCKSADNGHLQARYTLGQIFEYTKQDHVQAYVWYSLSDKFNEDELQHFVDKNLTTEEYQKARLELLGWLPAQCERSLGL